MFRDGRILFYFVLLFSFFYVGICFSQNEDSEKQRMRRARDAQKRSEALFQGKVPPGTATVFGRSMIHSVNSGFGNTIALLEAGKHDVVRQELGLSEEQGKQLKAARDMLQIQVAANAPKYVNRFKSMSESDHESIQKDLVGDFKKISDYVDGFTTTEQKEKTRTFVFQTMGGLDSPMTNLDTMSALKLTDEQKEKAQTTFKEMERERVAQMEEGLKLIEKTIEKGGVNMSPDDRAAIEEEGKALEARIFAMGKKLGDRLRRHLTEEQLSMEKHLLANRPAYLPKLPGPMRGDFSSTYSPGLDSWTPGQGAPKDSKEEKKRRRPFPQKENVATE